MKMSNEDAIVSKKYHIKSEIFEKGIEEYQRKAPKKKAIIFTVLFALVICMQIYYIAADMTRSVKISFVVIAVCIAFIFGEWTRPRRIRKQLIGAMKQVETDTVNFNLYEDRITILMNSKEELDDIEEENDEVAENCVTDDESSSVEEEWTTTLNLFNKYLTIDEKEDFYLLKQGDTMIYVVPKADFSEDEIKTMNDIFKEKMEGQFTEYKEEKPEF
jgi:hypothetical protein